MPDYIPPYPERPREPLTALGTLIAARRNLLAVFDDKCFEHQFFSVRLLNRRLFVCNSPDTVAEAFIEKHDSFARKTPQMRHALSPLVGDGLFVSDGTRWRQRRALVAPLFQAGRLPLFAPDIVEAATETAERWLRLPRSEPVDVLREMAVLAAETICRSVFKVRLGAAKAAALVAAFGEYQRRVGQIDLIYLLGLPDWLPRVRSPALRRIARRIQGILEDVIRQAEEGDSPSAFRSLVEAGEPEIGARLDRDAARDEAAVLLMAGHETTANALAWTWFLLSQAPEAEARLHAELDEMVGSRPPQLDDLPRLVFTRAVFEAAIRLYPPVPFLGRQAERDETLRRRAVPAGSLVAVIPWLLHRHRLLWQRPDHFVPERFLPENAHHKQRYSYLPFSVGPRACAGQAFGLAEALLCLAILAQRFRLRLAPGAIVGPVCRLSLRPDPALPMHIEPRPRR